MGTQLLARRPGFRGCLEELNISDPESVRQTHREYVLAGAEVVETNTFGANRVRLAGSDLCRRVDQVNRTAVSLAREAAGPEAFVAGAVGPLGCRIVSSAAVGQPDGIPGPVARAAFQEQIASLVGAGVDLVVLETFSHLDELGEALAAAGDVATRKTPLVVQVSLNSEGIMADGATIEELLQFLALWRPAAIGCNCSEGPASIRSAIERMAAQPGCTVSAQPSAGLPQRQGEQLVYPSSEGDFDDWAAWALENGVQIVGGCCGTTPDHIRAVRSVAEDWRHRPQRAAALGFAPGLSRAT